MSVNTMNTSRRNPYKNMAVRKPVTKQAVKQILQSRQEVKQFTSTRVNNQAMATAGTLLYLNQITQGDDIDDRSGDQVLIQEIRFHLTAFQATAATSSTFRVIMFSDSMGSGGFITVAELLQTADFTSPYNAINRQRGRFKVYSDRIFTLVGGTNFQERTDVLDIKPMRKVWFNDTTGAATGIGKNAFYALIISSAATGVFATQWGMRYTDS